MKKIYLINYFPYMALFFMYSFVDLKKLLGCSIKKTLDNNYLLNHLIGIFALYMFTMISNSNQPPIISLLISIPMYLLFLINTRGNYMFIIPNIIIIMSLYTIDKTRIYNLENNKISENTNKIIKNIEVMLFSIFILISIIGFIYYIINLNKNNKNWTFINFYKNKNTRC
tara:strand:+ start:164 stop:673 length:510 start_codon:yes stop_codon:yes gene_type:complete